MMMVRDRLPVRTARVSDTVWDKAKARATSEGTTMSQVVATLVQGYAHEALDLPTLVYRKARLPVARTYSDEREKAYEKWERAYNKRMKKRADQAAADE